MKLHVQVMEARNLLGRDHNGFSDPFVRLHLGSTKAKSSVVSKNLSPMWYEDFYFNVGDLDVELIVTVWDQDRVFDDFLGQMKMPVSTVLDSEKQSLPPAWYPLQKKSEKSKVAVSGEILLGFSLYGRAGSSHPGSAHPLPHVQSPRFLPSSVDTLHIRTNSLDSDSSETDSVAAADSPAVLFASPEPSRFHLSSPLGDSPSIGSPDVGSPRFSDSGTPRFAGDGSRFGSEGRVASPSPLGDHSSSDSTRYSEGSVDRSRKTRRRSFGRLSGLFATRRSQTLNGTALLSPSERGPTETHLSSDQGSELSGEEADTAAERDLPLTFFEDDGTNDVPKSGAAEPSGDEEEEILPLSGGTVLDQSYAVSFKTLNALLFKPGSDFVKDVTAAQKTTELVEGPWEQSPEGNKRRTVTYVKAATRLVKAVKATEEQTYIKADSKGFAVLMCVSTPDAPYGDTFKTEVQMNMTPGPDLPTGEKTSHLTISWRMIFEKKTLMKSVIENGARQGIRDTYQLYGEVLAKFAKPVSNAQLGNVPIVDDVTPKSDWEAALEYFGNLPVILCLFSLAFMLLHIRLALPGVRKLGLEFWWFDFPDTLGALFTSAVVALQVEHVAKMIYRFLRARYLRSSDHGIKAQGLGWLLTVTLLEGESLPSADLTGYSDPYVVFTCNGKTRSSSVKLQTLNPQWREIFEFDATEDPPSTMDVEVFDYDGPLSDPESLGHAEINFLRMAPDQLADLWISLSGKKAKLCGSRLHLRVYLRNTKEADVRPEYLEKVEKEAKTKIGKRSPQRNTSFQRLFSLPEEEFLINDFACAVKKKIPLQGRVFLSPRMLGFYSNLFGHKTKFSLLWEDIDEIQELTPSLASVGSLFNPSIVIFVRKGRGKDAKQGARRMDASGRLKFQLLSFVRPGPAFRTIIALWKNRTLSPEQQMEIVASVEAGDMKYAVAERQADDDAPFLGVEDAKMTQVSSLEVPVTVEQVLCLFEDENLDERIASKAGCLNYKTTPWEPVRDKPHVHRRQVNYKYSNRLCRFGSVVTCAQQRTISEDKKLVVMEEILTLHDVPFGDHFQVHIRKELETVPISNPLSVCKVFLGVAWHKSTVFEKRITKNIHENIAKQVKEKMELTAKEIKLKKEVGNCLCKSTRGGG